MSGDGFYNERTSEELYLIKARVKINKLIVRTVDIVCTDTSDCYVCVIVTSRRVRFA